MTTSAHRVTALTSLTSDTLVAADGTIWSHAATLGSYIKGPAFTIDREKVENFVRVFKTGYPQKVPVDYEHGTVNGATDHGRPVPKAGDVLELRGVFAEADFTGDLLTAAKKQTEKAGRSLNDERNFGLWMRWKPTKRALGMIEDEEYSELSIAFDKVKHNVTGADQGDVLISVALTNLPFLDGMLGVAAARGGRGDDERTQTFVLQVLDAAGGVATETEYTLHRGALLARVKDPAAGASAAAHAREEQIMSTKMLNATTVLTGKAVATEDEGVAALTALGTELAQHRTLARDVGAELGETDPTKVVAKVKELKELNITHETAAKTAKEAVIASTVEATMKAHEKKFTVPMKTLLAAQLTRELTAGTKVEETETVKALKSMPDLSITGRQSAADVTGGDANNPEKRKLARVTEILSTNEEVKALARTSAHAAYMRAVDLAEEEEAATV